MSLIPFTLSRVLVNGTPGVTQDGWPELRSTVRNPSDLSSLAEQAPQTAYCPSMLIKFEASGPLAREIKRDVEAYLATQDSNLEKRQMVAKSALIFAWAAGSYGALVFWASTFEMMVLLSTSLALAMAGIGFSIQHDANHGSYPASSGWQRALGFTLDLMGGSSYIWKFQHNVNHHSFTNVVDADADINLGQIARLAPTQPYRPHFRWQKFYLWPLYSLLGISWVLWADWRDFFGSSIGSNRYAPATGRERLLFWAGKLAWVVIWLVVPLSVHTAGAWLPTLLWTYLVLGFTLSMVFQLAHIVEEADFPPLTGEPARCAHDFCRHQLETTVNFAPENRLLTWYLGGLNYQIEHHLFPKVSHVHYPAIALIVRRACIKHGAPYHSLPTFRAALASHARWLHRMGQPEAATQA